MNMSINGNQKGKAGERELCKVIREAGFEARRGQQFCGANGDEDVIHSIPGLHIECKRVEKLNVLKAWEQAARDAKDFRTPTLMHRCNRSPWLVTLSLRDFLALIKVTDGIDPDTA